MYLLNNQKLVAMAKCKINNRTIQQTKLTVFNKAITRKRKEHSKKKKKGYIASKQYAKHSNSNMAQSSQTNNWI